jgi:hypothetical protein
MVPELGVWNIERDRAFALSRRADLIGRHEAKLGLSINESPDQPRASDPVYPGACASDVFHTMLSSRS